MNKQEWAKKLSKELKELPSEERRRVLEYYDELFADRIDAGQKEKDIIASLGDPKEAAAKILADYDAYLKREDEPEETEKEPAGGLKESGERGFETKTDIKPETYDREPLDKAERESGDDDSEYDVYGSGENYAKVRKLKIDVVTPEIVIRRANAFSLKVPQSGDIKYDVNVGGDTLYIKEGTKSFGAAFRRFFGFGAGADKLVLELPALESVTCKATKNGCRINGFSLRRVTLETVGGDLSVTGCDTEYMSLTATGGDAEIKGGLHESVSVTASSGDITASDLSAETLTLSATGGDVTLKDVSVKDTARCATVGGDIIADVFECANAECKTVSGEIELGVAGSADEYCAVAKTLMGGIHIPASVKESGAKNKLTLSSVSGDITLKLTE